MELQPVRRYAPPQLPTRDVASEHPELLRLLPRRWQSNPTVIAALTAALAMSITQARADRHCSLQQPGQPTLVAPVFHHGDTKPDPYPPKPAHDPSPFGAYGCVSVAPPRYLTEHDAQQALRDEALRAGINFRPRYLCLKNVEVPRDPAAKTADSKDSDQKPETFTLHFDGADNQQLIVYEYVSDSDLASWKIKGSTTERTAEVLRENLVKKNSPGTFAVFYGPDQVSGTSEEEVRQQMRDFIVWLKAQGVI